MIFGKALEAALEEGRVRLGARANRRPVWCRLCGVKVAAAEGRQVRAGGRAVGYVCGVCSRRW